MEGQQHTNTSRLTEWQQEQSLSQVNPQQQTLTHHSVSQQSRKLKHIPMSKLSLNYIFIKKQHQKHLYKQHLDEKNKSAHNYFYQMRQNFQSDIYAFMKKYQSMNDMIDEQESAQQSVSEISSLYLIKQNISEEYSSKRMRRMTEESISSPSRSKESSKKVNEGGYFWNNWRSYQTYPCIKAINENTFTVIDNNSNSFNNNTQNLVSPQNLSSHLVYAIIDMDFDRALKIIDNISQQWSFDQEQGQSNKTRQNVNSILGSKHVKEVVVFSRGENKRLSHQGNNIKSIPTKSIINNNVKMQKQNSLNLKSLRIIIKGLKTLSSLIKFTDELNNNSQLSQTFFYRDQFHLLEDHYLNDPKAKINLLNISIEEIESSEYFKQSMEIGLIEQVVQSGVKDRKKFDKKPSYNTRPQSPMRQRKTMKSTQNLMNFKNSPKKPKSIQQLKFFLQLKPKYQKICILNNLMFIINFAKKIRIQNCENDYFRLLFCYLKNGHDQMIQGRCEIEWKEYNNERRKNSDESNKLSPLLQQESSDNLSQVSSMMFKPVASVNYRQQIDYLSLLLSLQRILIFDRINLATRLLPKHKKIRFTQQLHSRIVKFPYIDNLLLFTKSYKQQMSKLHNDDVSYVNSIKSVRETTLISHNRVRTNSIEGLSKWATSHQLYIGKQRSLLKLRANQQQQQQYQCLVTKDILANKLISICQNYIDKTGDLATVAYLSIQYDCLQKYFDYYRESLLLSFEQDEVDKLDAMKQATRGEQWTDKKTYLTKKCVPFLEQVNFKQEKLNDNTHQQIIEMIDSRRCEICSLKIFPDKRQCYIECSKCRHGGHFEHLIKWYNSYQNCPNVNCACVCN